VFDSGGTQYGAADAPYPNLARNGQWSMGSRNSLLALSRAGGRPSLLVTWFQANVLCRAAGKRLPTGDEWLIAADDLVRQDPATPLNGNVSGVTGCNTGGTGPRNTGGGTGCVSSWGAQDMIGNVWELTAEWYAGVGNETNGTDMAWPPTSNLYAGDGTWNITSSAFAGSDGVRSGIPSAAIRGGSWGGQGRAGVFALYLSDAPSNWGAGLGFRCVLQR
jgi:formylglycine-generating enzyme required for sulfatase activity